MAKVVKSGCIILPSVSPKNDKKDKHFAIFDIFGKTKSEIFDIIAKKHFAIFDIFQETKSAIFDKREKTGCNTCRFI